MNWLKYITREEPIAGLEISDTHLRLALFEVNPKTEKTELTRLVEKPLDPDVILGGAVGNPQKLARAVGEIMKTGARSRVNYAIVTIPADFSYSHIFSFPKTVSGEKLEETMKLTVGFQLPAPPENLYLDWEHASSEESRNNIFLITAPKTVINGYITALKAANLRMVAIEFPSVSINRVVEAAPDKAFALLLFSQSGITVSFLRNKTVQFTRFLPAEKFPEAASSSLEIAKMIDFYEAEGKIDISALILVGGGEDRLDKKILNIPVLPAPLKAEYALRPEVQSEPNRYAAVLGAATRGILARAEDGMVSLMPVGTEEAYENQKAVAFTEFLSTMTMALAVFFVVIYGGVWAFLNSAFQTSARQLQTTSELPLPADTATLEARATQLNDLTEQSLILVRKMERWSGFLEELRNRVVPGIKIVNLSVPNLEALISMSGVAENRTQLNAFKKSLEESSWLTDVIMPLTNPAQKEKISFSVTFQLKDQSLILPAGALE
ncbi:MAG: pilus assembly protein PilM [Candidatus Liptonbacteria bacterium]